MAGADVRTAGKGSLVSGVVFDSLANLPLYGALVQLVATDDGTNFGSTVVSDAQGRFQFLDVPAGRYRLGFHHAMLDSLGVDPPLRSVTIDNDRPVRADLAIASPTRLRAAICGGPASPKAPAVVMGFVRDARTGQPIVGVTVAAEWVELSIGRQGVTRRAPRKTTTTESNGWYAICDVPSPGAVKLTAFRHTDSTDVIDIDVPASGFMRRAMFLGAARTVASADSAGASAAEIDSAFVRRRIHVGGGVVRGTVLSAIGGRALADAQVGIMNGPQTRSNGRGEWTISNAPEGTRTLEVRAVGYYPARQVVDVIDGAPAVGVQLTTFKSVLDTLKVIAQYDRYSSLAGFRERSKSGLGRFLTADDVARRQPVVTSDLFTAIPGVFVDGPRGLEQNLYMRGVFEERCIPTVYLNGGEMGKLSANDIDALIRPEAIIGIEVYRESQAPGQFIPPLSGCGSIAFWVK